MGKRGPQPVDMTGLQFGRLTVLRQVENSPGTEDRPYGRIQWLCRCECGTETIASGMNLRRGETKSCGCLRRGMAHQKSHPKIHGQAIRDGTPTYRSWGAMKTRCYNPNSDRYPSYGARGIKVCDRWRDSFVNFFADMGERPEGKTLGRFGDKGDYEPGNVQWMTPAEQAANRYRT
jgi:hypothetical protein